MCSAKDRAFFLLRFYKKYEAKEKIFNKQFSDTKKKIICLQTLEVFESAREIERKLNIPYRLISASCLNKSSTNGYNFEFYEEGKNYIKLEKKKIHKQVNRKIKCLETGEVFNSMKSMEKIIKVTRKTISEKINNNKQINGKTYVFI